jgi:hypothetical protein
VVALKEVFFTNYSQIRCNTTLGISINQLQSVSFFFFFFLLLNIHLCYNICMEDNRIDIDLIHFLSFFSFFLFIPVCLVG